MKHWEVEHNDQHLRIEWNGTSNFNLQTPIGVCSKSTSCSRKCSISNTFTDNTWYLRSINHVVISRKINRCNWSSCRSIEWSSIITISGRVRRCGISDRGRSRRREVIGGALSRIRGRGSDEGRSSRCGRRGGIGRREGWRRRKVRFGCVASTGSLITLDCV